jgi:hypothetical protein
MTIGIGVGLAEFPFSSASAFWGFRGYPETFSHCYSEITQPPCGNETQGDRRKRAGSA